VTAPCGKTDVNAYAYSYPGNSQGESCTVLTDGNFMPSHVDAHDDKNNTDPVKAKRHLILTQDGGDTCGEKKTQSSITYEIFCDNVTDTSKMTVDDTDPCNPRITFTHKAGCPVASLSSIAIFFDKYPWVLAVLLIIAGPIINFYGKKFIPIVISVVGGLFTALLVLIFSSSVGMLDYIDPTVPGGNGGMVALAFILAIALGTVVGLLLFKFLVVGLCIMGACAGFLAGGLLYNLVFLAWAKNTVLLGFCTFGLATAGAVAAYFWREHIIIIATSMIGSYFTIRGISLFAGKFPSEILLYEQINNGTATFTYEFIGYLVGIAVLFVLGVIYQEKKKDDHVHHDEKFKRVK